eukprot:13694772-Alexandrium_andersonii.AAC.1
MGGILLGANDRIVACWADALSAEDLERFSAAIGDPSFQAEWELLAAYASLRYFEQDLQDISLVIQ